MKPSKQLILNNRGSTLILTLIVFMTILILGMTMVSSILYSQNENNMQIHKQKAYYAAQSAADAVKSYFLNPTSTFVETKNIVSPEELIGTTGTYTLKDQGLGEETVVSITINKEDTFVGTNKDYILIEAVGTHQNQQSTVKVRLLQEKQVESANVYGDKVVFGGNYFKANNSSSNPITVKGNVFIDDSISSDGVNISGVDLSESNGEERNTLYIEGKESTITLQNSKLQDVYLQFNSKGLQFNDNEVENAYIKYEDQETNPWVALRFDRNIISGEAQLFTKNIVPGINKSKIGQRLILSLDVGEIPSWKITDNEVSELYIKGAKKLGAITGVATQPIEVLYTDASVYENLPYYYIKEIIQKDLTELNAYEEKVTTHLNNVKATSELLKEKPSWNKEGLSSSFIKLEQENPSSPFEEYYDPTRKIRLVFASGGSGWYKVEKGTPDGNYDTDTYYVSDEALYAEDQVFFIAEQAKGVKFNLSVGEGLDSFYLYAPRAQCEFINNFDYLKGSIIAEKIIIGSTVEAEFIFKEPENADGIGVPGGSGTGQSSYKYHFVEYMGL